MNNAKIPFTAQGYAKLEADLAQLRAKREPTVLRLQAAREQGDLSENGAYKAARFELSDIDRNIRRLTYLLKTAVITPARHDGTIGFGNTIVLEKDGKEFTYMLVGKYESDPRQKKLSVDSPLGAALVGKKAGESVAVTAPAGSMQYTIMKIV